MRSIEDYYRTCKMDVWSVVLTAVGWCPGHSPASVLGSSQSSRAGDSSPPQCQASRMQKMEPSMVSMAETDVVGRCWLGPRHDVRGWTHRGLRGAQLARPPPGRLSPGEKEASAWSIRAPTALSPPHQLSLGLLGRQNGSWRLSHRLT